MIHRRWNFGQNLR